MAAVATVLAAACGPPPAARSGGGPGSAAPDNPIVAYLRGAELQAEDEAQVANVRRALEDLATLPAEQLPGPRYQDYAGAFDVWDLPRVLRAHFLPARASDAGIVDDPEAFFRAADDPAVRALAAELVTRIEAGTVNDVAAP